MSKQRPKRRAPISYRPPKGREAEFEALLAEHGGSANAFITERIFGGSRRRPSERKLLARLLAQAARISDQLHEISLGGGRDSALLIEDAHDVLVEIRAALLKDMGRKP